MNHGECSSPAGIHPRKLLVVLPALNEEATIADVVSRIPREMSGIGSVQVVVVDDGSDDATARKALEEGAQVIRHATNCGVGAAIHTGLSFGIDHRADLIVTMDADGQFDPADIPELIGPVVEGDAAFSTASRFKDRTLTPEIPRVRLWGNRAMSWLISRLIGQRFYDVSCGMRCYSRAAALRLNLLGAFTYTQEVFLNLSFKKLRMVEVPIRVRGSRPVGKSRVAPNLVTYALRALFIIFRAYRDYHAMRMFGCLAAVLAAGSLVFGGFLLNHYVHTGTFSPHKWAGVAALFLLALGLLSIHVGIIGDMMNRHRIYLEEILLRQRSDPGGEAFAGRE
jgi:glycosyltransferase involved in cell wall biosynthesis